MKPFLSFTVSPDHLYLVAKTKKLNRKRAYYVNLILINFIYISRSIVCTKKNVMSIIETFHDLTDTNTNHCGFGY